MKYCILLRVTLGNFFNYVRKKQTCMFLHSHQNTGCVFYKHSTIGFHYKEELAKSTQSVGNKL